MPFFELFWLTSWVGCLLASSQGLLRVPNYLSTARPAIVLPAVGNPLQKYTPLVVPAQPQTGVWFSNYYRAAVSSIGFQHNGDSRFQFNSAKPTKFSSSGLNEIENSLCRPVSEQKDNSLSVVPDAPYPTGYTSLVEESPSKVLQNSRAKKILHNLQNLFHRSKGEEQDAKRSPVVVVSTKSVNQASETFVANKPRALPGFRLYLKSLSGGAAAKKTSPNRNQELFQVWVKGHLIAQMPEKQRANLIAQELANLLQDSNLNASQLQPALDNGMPAGKMGDRVLFVIHDALASQLNSNPQLLAIEWVNNLRTALDAPPLKLTEAQSLMYGLVETEAKIEGFASWYGDYFHGRLTANGETYNQYELTAAHRSLPFNTYLKVTNLENGESAIVRINDRGPYIPPRNLDLSRVAARCINSEGRGVVPFEAVIMQPLPTQSAAASQELTRLAAQTADRF
jgi:rare lipoprotein A